MTLCHFQPQSSSFNNSQPGGVICLKKRCAVYTRKSTTHGLDIRFNSLEAQKESCEHYIKSQKYKGYQLVNIKYSDGGFSGGSIKRPGLEKLLEDVEGGLIDAVVVHKVDRLSRSISDFAKMMSMFEKHNVEFVSVTQNFDTSTSMGKLVLNILLSFSEFEREIGRERAREKILAAKKKGMWTGGIPPFGYRAKDKRLVVCHKEAKIIKYIFQHLSGKQGVIPLLDILKDKFGEFRANVNNSWIYATVSNSTYCGMVKHKDKVYPGQHPAIVSQKLFDRVASQMQARPKMCKSKSQALFKGVIFCGYCGHTMTPTTGKSHSGIFHNYYRCMTQIKTGSKKCFSKSISAPLVEGMLLPHFKDYLSSAELRRKIWNGIPDKRHFNKLPDFAALWGEFSYEIKRAVVEDLVKRMEVTVEKVTVRFTNGKEETFLRHPIKEIIIP